MPIAVLQSAIDRLLLQQDRVVVAIDGKCTSGKTTLASKLAEIYDCNVFHMDDFSSGQNSAPLNGLQRWAAM